MIGCSMDAELKNDLGLTDANDFHYVKQGGCNKVEGIADEKEWDDLLMAMQVLNMTEEEKRDTFRLTSVVAHLGNVEFEVNESSSSSDASKIAADQSTAQAVDHIVRLLQCPKEMLSTALTSKKIGAHSVVYVAYTVEQAKATRDALAKALYGSFLLLFLLGRN